MEKIAVRIDFINAQTMGHCRVKSPDPLLHIFFRNQGKGHGVFALLIYEKEGMKDLYGLMSVHGRAYFGNYAQIVVDELTQPPVVIDGSRS